MLAIALGILSGVFVGLLPSLGNLSALVLFYPLLVQLDPMQIVMFYIAQLSVSQYFGNLMIMTSGVSAEPSSVFGAREGYSLSRRGYFDIAVVGAAVGSWIGSWIGIAALFLAVLGASYILPLLTTTGQMIVFTVALGCMIFVCKNNVFANLMLILLGLGLGMIGYNTFNYQSYGVVHSSLSAGIPMPVLVLAMLTVPNFFVKYQTGAIQNTRTGHAVKLALKNIRTILESGSIGAVASLVPGVSYIFSSQAAVLRAQSRRRSDYRTVLAAETANNAGSIGTLIPLLFFGIPITASEAFVFEMVVYSGADLFLGAFIEQHLSSIVVGLVAINIIGFGIALIASRELAKFCGFVSRYSRLIIVALVLVSVTMLGFYTGSVLYYLTVYIALVPLAWLFRNHDLIPLIFAFILHDQILENANRLLIMYS